MASCMTENLKKTKMCVSFSCYNDSLKNLSWHKDFCKENVAFILCTVMNHPLLYSLYKFPCDFLRKNLKLVKSKQTKQPGLYFGCNRPLHCVANIPDSRYED